MLNYLRDNLSYLYFAFLHLPRLLDLPKDLDLNELYNNS